MHTEEEIREDLDRLKDVTEALMLKYGEDFSIIMSSGVRMPDAWAGSCLIYGDGYLLHQASHALLENPRFIDEFFDAVKCVLVNSSDKPEFLKEMMKQSIESFKRLLIINSKQFKEHLEEKEAEESVKNLLRQTGFTN